MRYYSQIKNCHGTLVDPFSRQGALDARTTFGGSMKVGNLVRHRFSESGMLGIVIKKGVGDKWFISWGDGRVSWTVRTLFEAVDESG
jgi:hypothetical protein